MYLDKMGKQKLLIIANPFSGTSSKSTLKEEAQKKIDQSKYDLHFEYTTHAGHAIELSKQAIGSFDIVVAAGGDGTVNEVASGIIGSDVILGILPGGSGNGFAMHLGLGRNAIKAMDVINHGVVKVVDTCSVNDKFFINVAGLGFDARIAYLTKLNKNRGFFHYFNTTLGEAPKFKALPLYIEADGEVIEGNFAAAVVANASMYGYNFTIAPTAALDDGLFDIMLIKEAPIYRYFMTSYRFLNKTLHKSPLVINKKAKEINIKIVEQDYYHVDGEGFLLDQDLKFKMQPKSMKVLQSSEVK